MGADGSRASYPGNNRDPPYLSTGPARESTGGRRQPVPTPPLPSPMSVVPVGPRT